MGDGIEDLGGGSFDIGTEVQAINEADRNGDLAEAAAQRALLDQITTHGSEREG